MKTVIASYVEHPAYSFSKMYSVLILVFDLPLFTQSACLKVTFLKILGAP